MEPPGALTDFFAAYTAVTVAMYLISVVSVLTMRGFMVRWCKQRFGVGKETVLRITVQWLAAFNSESPRSH
jgi:hypothetical protein